MKLLGKKVAEGLKRNATFTVTPEELKLVWPVPFDEQQKLLRAFVEEHGWRLLHCTETAGAVIAKRSLGF